MEQGAVRKRLMKFGVGITAVLLVVVVVGPARSAVPSKDADVSASATGTVLHAGLLQSGDTRIVDAEVGFTGAAYDSHGLQNAENEMERRFASAGKKAYGRGSAVEAGLAVTHNDDNQLILAGKAESSGAQVTKEIGPLNLAPLAWANLARGRASAASISSDCVVGSDLSNGAAYVADAQLLDTGSAPTSTTASKPASTSSTTTSSSTPLQQTVDAVTKPVTGLLGSLTGGSTSTTTSAPVAAPSLSVPQITKVQPKASTDAQESGEGLSSPLIALDATGPARAVSQSRSRTFMVAQRGKDGTLLGHNFGVMSEVRQTIAPVTLFKGTVNEITIEFLGEWVLQAVSTGMPGGAYIHYGPGAISPSTPVLRILQKTGVTNILKLQDLLGDKGLVINIPGLAEIAIGEDPRAIGGDADSQPQIASNGTSAAAAVDAVRVRLLPGAPAKLADIRVGHMEVRTAVPQGGVGCPIPVTKKPSKNSVSSGDTFTTTFEVSNNTDCVLRNVRLSDHVTTEGDAKFTVTDTNPNASSGVPSGEATEATIQWNDLPDIPVGGHDVVVATFKAAGGAGAIVDKATSSADPSDCAQAGTTVGGVAVSVVGATLGGSSNEVRVPVGGVEVGAAVATPVSRGELPRTGAPILLIVLGSMGLLAAGGAALTLAYRMR